MKPLEQDAYRASWSEVSVALVIRVSRSRATLNVQLEERMRRPGAPHNHSPRERVVSRAQHRARVIDIARVAGTRRDGEEGKTVAGLGQTKGGHDDWRAPD